MKLRSLISAAACCFCLFTLVPSADAGYRRTIIGHDSKGKPIIRVVWVADHLDFPRTVYERRRYPTSVRRDPETLVEPDMTLYPSPGLISRSTYFYEAPERESDR